MKAAEIRDQFLKFFNEKKHQVVPSAPIVLKNDPSLMFTNAGMNQFKDYFLGTKTADYTRAVDTQKCLRVSGKHNDLEEVGVDTYHHTMFEMLGNWSFGDYFKKEAIEWSWELLTSVYGLEKDRLYVTVFEGDSKDALERDTEAVDFWKNIVDESRIINGNKKDNFWEMGEQGPCGPCSEVHIDLRSDEERGKIDGKSLVNQDDPQVIEIWNLVFIQYNRKANGDLEALPSQHVDTGMGFERLVRAIQGKSSNYDTDVFTPLIEFVEQQTGKQYGQDEKTDIAIRVIVDHIRAITFTIADGQLPSNNGAGYVIRRILRRAVRYAYTFLDVESPFIFKLVDHLAIQFESVFPEVKAQKDFIQKVVEEEEVSFLRTLKSGIQRLNAIKEECSTAIIDGKKVFELYDTFGFPVDLTALIAKESQMEIDQVGFEKEMAIQKERSRSAATSEKGDWTVINDGDVIFHGYDQLESESRILRYREIEEKKKKSFQIVLENTPFYPEGGGQVGDKGYFEANGEKVSVIDTKKENDLIIHFVDKLPSDLTQPLKAVVNRQKRELAANNHTATHLLQAALREILGDHVDQKGSLVNDKLLRFDFTHFSKVTDEEIAQVEALVNQKIRENIALLEERAVPIEEARAKGARALFGEKYGDTVRVITFDPDFSIELCGGIHVPSTSVIGQFKITAESSVAAGVRRVEAITAQAAEDYINKKLAVLDEVNELLKVPKDISKAVGSLIEERADLLKKVEQFRQQAAKGLKSQLLNTVKAQGGSNLIIEQIEAESADTIKQVAFDLRKELDSMILVLAANIGGKPQVLVMISDSLVESKKLNAGQIVRDLAKEIQGGGGGQAFFATAGGKNLEGLGSVVEKAQAYFESEILAS